MTSATKTSRGWASGKGPRLVLLIVVSGVGAAAALLLVGGATSPDDDQLAIRTTIEGAIIAEHTLEVPDIADNGSPRAADAQAQLIERARHTLAKYYTGAALAQELSTFENVINHDANGQSGYLAGGMDAISYTTITVTGGRAIITAEARTWNRIIIKDANKKATVVEPHGLTDYDFSLIKLNGRWYIDGENLHSAPGNGL